MTRRPVGCLGLAFLLLVGSNAQMARASVPLSPHTPVPTSNPAARADSAEAQLEPACTPPTPNVSVIKDCNSIKLTGSVPGGTSCIPDRAVIYRDGVLKVTIRTLPPTWTDDAPIPGTNHKYEVKLYNGSTVGGTRTVYASSNTPGQMSTPTVARGCSSLKVSWSTPSSPSGRPDTYVLYRNDVFRTFVYNSRLTFDDDAVSSGVSYSYKVKAILGACTGALSPASAPASLTTPTTPAKPTVAAECKRVAVRWSAVDGSTAYRIYRNGGQIAEISSALLAYTDTSAVTGSTYAVQAVSGACLSGLSPASNTVSPILGGATPSRPTAEGLCGKIRVSWYSVAEPVSGYSIYRNGTYVADVPKTQNWYDDQAVTGPATYTVAASNGGCLGSPSSASLVAEPTNPGQPGNVTATASCAGVTVSWTVASGSVTGYQISRNGQPLTSVGPSPTQYPDTEASGTVSYAVTAVNGGCPGRPSASSSPVTRPATPSAPGIPSVAEGCGKLSIDWKAASSSSSVTGYRLYRGESFLIEVGPAVLRHDDVGAPPNSTYKVMAVNGECEGPFSGISASASPMLIPAAPGTPNLTPGCGTVEVRWAAPAPPITGFKLYRNGTALDRTFDADVLSYRDESPPATVNYAVSALNGSCESPLSGTSATIQIPSTPGVPGTPTAAGGCGMITVSWAAASGSVTGYRVLRLGTFLEQVSGLSFPDRSAPPNSTYQIVAVNGECQGPASGTSNPASLTVAPAAPTELVATPGCGVVALSWKPPLPPFTGFKLYKNNVALAATLSETDRTYEDNAATGNASYKVSALNGSCESAASTVVSAAPALRPRPPSAKPTATAGCGKLTVSWGTSATAGVTRFRIYRGEDPLVYVPATPRTYDDTGAPPNAVYQISAVIGTCEGDKSAPSDPRSPLASPGTPGTPVATGICSGVQVTWEKIPGFTGQYALYRDGSFLIQRPATEADYTDGVAPAGSQYQVSARTPACEGPLSASSAPASPINPGPVGISQVTVECDRLIVTWSVPTGTVTGYRVYRNSEAQSDLPADQLRYEDIGAPPSSVYRISALNGSCEGLSSTPSNPQSPLVLPVVADAPEVTPDCGGVGVSWTAATGTVDAYWLYRGEARIAELSGTTLHHTDTAAAGEFRYAVRAARESCAGPLSPASALVRRKEVPGVTLAPLAAERCGFIHLSWQSPGGPVTAYRVLRNDTPLAELDATMLHYSDHNPLPTAHYAIVSLNEGCAGPVSPRSDAVSPTGRPEEPTTPALEATCGQVTVQWREVAGATSYVILRDGARVDSIPAGEPFRYVDRAPGRQARSYAVAAKNDCGEAHSAAAAVTAPARPDPPSGLRAEILCGSVRLAWEPQADIIRYKIYRDGVPIDSVSTGATFQDTSPGTGARQYEVSALGACGESERSARATATAGLVPAAPGTPSLTTGCGSIRVRWNAVADAQTYLVRRDGQLLAESVTGTEFTDSAPGRSRHCYTVQAAAAACQGLESSDACATAEPCARELTINLAGSDRAAGYRMVAFPIVAADPSIEATIQDDLGAPDDANWRFGCWIATLTAGTGVGGYAEPNRGLTSLQPGLGYWVLTRKAARIRVSGLPVEADPFELPLSGPANSWHQIGNPYFARVPVSSIRVRVDGHESEPLLTQSGNLTDRVFQRWDQGQFVPETALLDTLTGYWLHKIDARTVTLLFPAPTAAGLPDDPDPAPAWPTEAGWAIALEACQGDETSGRLLLGVGDVPAEGWNPLSLAAPPAPLGGAPTLAARVSTWGALSGGYQRLIQRDAERLIWTIQLDGLRPGFPVTLRLTARDFPVDRQVDRCDALGRVVQNWELDTPGALPAVGESMTLHFLVHPRGDSVTPPVVAIPRLRASPNPFRYATELTVEQAQSGPVRLEIFDARGRFVRRIDGTIDESKIRTLWWDARDANGHLVSGGIYFVRPEGDGTGVRPLTRLVKLP